VTVAISFDDPWLPDAAEGDNDRRDISTFADKHDHIHGHLSIVIADQPLRHLGYFGPDDACLGAWLAELRLLLQTLSAPGTWRYVYDEGEQGQPAFQFERGGDDVYVSVVDSEIDGAGDPEWGVQTCRFDDLQVGIERFLASMRELGNNISPNTGEEWWAFQLNNAT